MFWRRKDKQSNFLALELAKRLAPVLEQRLNKMSQPFSRCPDPYDSTTYGTTPESPYTVRVEGGSNKKECFVKFNITRGHIPGHSPYPISFVLVTPFSGPLDVKRILQYFGNAAYKEKLEPKEYEELRSILLDFFGGWKELEYEYRSDGKCEDERTGEVVTVY